MLKLKEMLTKPVIYQGLEVDVPVDTNYMWLCQSEGNTELMASPNKPVWYADQGYYLASSQSTRVAVLEHADLTAQQVKDSLETDEDKPTEQDLKQLEVVENLINNLRCFADTLERNVAKVGLNQTSDNIQALLQHVYADEGELDTFISHAIGEAEHYGISTNTEDADDYVEIVKLLASILK